MRHFNVILALLLVVACPFGLLPEAGAASWNIGGNYGSFTEQDRVNESYWDSGLGRVSYRPLGNNGGMASAYCSSYRMTADLIFDLPGVVNLEYATVRPGSGIWYYPNAPDYTNYTLLKGSGSTTASGMLMMSAETSNSMYPGSVSIIWSAGRIPGKDPDNPVPVDDDTDETASIANDITGAYLWSDSTTASLPVTGSYGKTDKVYVNGASGTSGGGPAGGQGDPIYALGYGFISADDGPKFTRLLLTEALPGGQTTFELYSSAQSYGMVTVGTEFDLTTIAPEGVSNFGLMGIDPAEQLSPTAPFPMTIGLQMASEGVLNLRASTFSNLPEPSVVVLLAIGGAGLLSCAARRWSRWMLRA